MEKSVVTKGKTIKDAVMAGLQLLQSEEDQVAIEILQNEEKRMLGLANKPAIVKLTRLSTGEQDVSDQHSFQNEEQPVTNSKGQVWVQNGKVFCTTRENEVPMIEVPDGVRFLLNKKPVKEHFIVLTEKDELELENTPEVNETIWDVKMSRDKLSVQLSVTPGYTIMRSIKDAPPSNNLKLQIHEIKIHENTLKYEKIMMKLELLHVRYGLNQNEIIKAMETEEPGTFEIATGLHPKPGREGFVEYRVEIEVRLGKKVREDGSIDFRETKTIPNVSEGQVIAVVHPPITGQPGITVTNEPLAPKAVFPVVIKEGKGVMSIESANNITIIASESGRPFIEKRGQLVSFMIMQKMVHKGNVDLESGNLRFQGDIEIFGEVAEKMEVEAKGNLFIHKNVYKSQLTASGSIVSNANVIGANMTAGKSNMILVSLGRGLSEISESFDHMLFLMRQLKHSEVYQNTSFEEKDLKPIVLLLIEKKFSHMPQLIKKFREFVSENDMLIDEEWGMIADRLYHYCVGTTREAIHLDKLEALSHLMKEWITLTKTPVEPDAYINIPFAMNAHLYSSGDVLIRGQGCYNTKVHAGGFLEIKGALRGGEVYGKEGVRVHDAGSEGRALTTISVPLDKNIHIQKVMEGTVLKVGTYKHIVEEERSNICAFVEDDQLIIK